MLLPEKIDPLILPPSGLYVVSLRDLRQSHRLESRRLIKAGGEFKLSAPIVRSFPKSIEFLGGDKMSISPDGRSVALSIQDAGRFRVEIFVGSSLRRTKSIRVSQAAVALNWSPSGRFITYSGYDRKIGVAEVLGSRPPKIYSAATSLVWSRRADTLFLSNGPINPFKWPKTMWERCDLVRKTQRSATPAQVRAKSWLAKVPVHKLVQMSFTPSWTTRWTTEGLFIPFYDYFESQTAAQRASSMMTMTSVDLFVGTKGPRSVVRNSGGLAPYSWPFWFDENCLYYLQSGELFGPAEAGNTDLWFGFVDMRTGKALQAILKDGIETIASAQAALVKG